MMVQPLTPPWFVYDSMIFNLVRSDGLTVPTVWRDGSWWPLDDNNNPFRMSAFEAASLGWRHA